MIKTILIVLAIVVIIFLIVVALQPAEYRVARSASISAAPADLFGQVNDLHKFQTWNPWARVDPACRNTYDGPPAGAGAMMAWAGNKEVGEGRMTITESRPSELIRMKMEFLKPFESTANTEFTFKPEGQQTVVTWAMTAAKILCPKRFAFS